VQALESFTAELVTCGQEIQRRRQALVPTLAERVKSAYGRLTGGTEAVRLTYQPSVQADFLVALAQVRSRELARRTTLLGPHLDELDLAIEEHPAAVFASEGQKRTLALALKMAQAEYLASVHGAPPVLLIDDVMGELDRERRAAFLPLLERAHQASGQVFMTATEENWPRELGRRLQRWHVENGHLQRLPPV